jgi:hypothetical protein
MGDRDSRLEWARKLAAGSRRCRAGARLHPDAARGLMKAALAYGRQSVAVLQAVGGEGAHGVTRPPA